MTRILATGDWHAGVATVDLEDQEQVWQRIVNVALDQEVDLFLHGGDVFEGPLVTPEMLRGFLNPMRRLIDHGIPILIVLGNGRHDLAMRSVNGLDVLGEIPGITVSSRPHVYLEGGAAICTLPWTSPARLVAEAGGEVERDALNAHAARLLVGIARDLLNIDVRREVEPWRPTILLAHWSISSGALPNGLPVADLKEPVLEWAELDALGFDAIIASHIHRPQRLDSAALGDATVGLYTGSPQPLNHGEPGEHGVWILDIEGGGGGTFVSRHTSGGDPGQYGTAVSTEFVPIESREFVTFDYQWDPDEPVAADTPWDEFIPEGAVVRLRYHATEEQARKIDQGAFRASLLAAGASRVSLEPQIIRASRARAETLTEDLSPLEALHMYGDAQGLDGMTNGRMVDRLREWMQA